MNLPGYGACSLTIISGFDVSVEQVGVCDDRQYQETTVQGCIDVHIFSMFIPKVKILVGYVDNGTLNERNYPSSYDQPPSSRDGPIERILHIEYSRKQTIQSQVDHPHIIQKYNPE